MTNRFKSDKAEEIYHLTNKIKEKNTIEGPQKNSGCGCNWVGISLLAGTFIVFFLIVFVGFSLIESNFLENTAKHEEMFKSLAIKYSKLKNKSQKPKDSVIFDKVYNFKPLICYESPDRNNRSVARINYSIPEARQPKTPNEANPIIRLTIINERTHKTRNSEVPIYDIIVDYIDVNKNMIVFTQKIKGDPQDYTDNRIKPGTIPITQAQKAISDVMKYTPDFAWIDSY